MDFKGMEALVNSELIYEICIGFILFWSSLSSSKNLISLFLPKPNFSEGANVQNNGEEVSNKKILGLIRLILAKFLFISCIVILWKFRESINFTAVCISYVLVFTVFIIFSLFRFK